ncbi:MAG: sigma 54-interacting transcriptional regulator [Pseudomonadota bacterium]|nr:sigma 54-interacting transcriptional regulator [Pseudomonadota bacterium]
MHDQSEGSTMPDEGECGFEDLLTDLAVSFVNVEPNALDGHIEDALRSIVLFLGIDRSTLGRFDDRHSQLMPTHSWAVRGVDPLPRTMDESHFPFLAGKMRAGEPTILERIADLPPEAAKDAAAVRHLGLKSMATFPLAVEGKVLGWLSFGALRVERQWPNRLVRRLRLIADIFANALSRRSTEEDLRHALAENVGLRKRLEAENAVWCEEVLHCRDFDEIVGESPRLSRVMLQVEQVAKTDSTVLLLGETGTGKDLIATAIHRSSRRAQRPLVRVNCAALPATLIESELFGHEKGAFSGAVARRPGRFELADGGTILLDEIGELPFELQAKLLRVLQSGEFERLGSSKTRHADARVVTSTNRDLETMVGEGTFRSDLYYRLSVFPIQVPALRERREDIPLLAAYFVEKLRAKLGRKVMRVPDRVNVELAAYDWPGNVRELENIVERSMIVSPGPELEVDGLPSSMRKHQETAPGVSDSETPPVPTLAEVERDYIRAVCERCGWRINGKQGAAERLGLKPNTLRSRMKKLGIERPTGASPSV